MVLLLAALYSVYKSSQDNKDSNNSNNNEEEEEEEPSQQQSLTESLQRGGAQLYQQTVSRCTAAAATETATTSATTTSSSMPNDVLVQGMLDATACFHLPPVATRTSGSGSASSQEGTTDSSPAESTHSHSVFSGISQQHSENTTIVDEDQDESLLSNNKDHNSNGRALFNDAVKQQWIDAVFGSDCAPASEIAPNTETTAAPATTTTTTQLPICGGKYQSVTVNIPPCAPPSLSCDKDTATNDSAQDQKIGLTVSRLSLGVYVQSVTGQAVLAGVEIGSILVKINELPVLAEPSKALLQRLWQYEGIFANSSATAAASSTQQIEQKTKPLPDNSILSDSAASVNQNHNHNNSANIQNPVALQFIRNGHIYTVLLLSPTHPWGIQWAPAANVPLVKRSTGRASQVPPGTLVATVDGHSVLRDSDPFHTATCILQAQTNSNNQNQPIVLQLVVPPAEARASHVEAASSSLSALPPGAPPALHTVTSSLLTSTQSSRRRESKGYKQKHTIDGIDFKFLPLGYAIGSLCHSDQTVYHEVTKQHSVGHKQRRPCVSVGDLAEAVAAGRIEAPLSSRDVLRTLLVPAAAAPSVPKYPPCPELQSLLDAWDPLHSLVYCLRFKACGYNETILTEQLQLELQATGTTNRKPLIEQLDDLTSSSEGINLTTAFLLPFVSLICFPRPDNQHATKLTSMLLKLSRRNSAFCQRLYFLLRSYISTFETSGPGNKDPRNLMALLNCLESLRFAEKELSGRNWHNGIGSNADLDLLNRDRPTRTTRALALGRVGSNNYWETSIRGVVADVDDAQAFIVANPTSATTKRKSSLKMFAWNRGKSSNQTCSNSNLRPSSVPRRRPPPLQASAYSSQSNCNSNIPQSTSLTQTPSTMYENMADFLTDLDKICGTIERSLQKSFRQKIADWALQPWSAGKDAALAEVTAAMRRSLPQFCSNSSKSSGKMLLVNPVESSELLSSVDCNECYILPSANFPILLTFNVSERRCYSDSIDGEECLYRTRIEIMSVEQQQGQNDEIQYCESFAVQCAVAGTVCESGDSTKWSQIKQSSSLLLHTWDNNGVLQFETRSALGPPRTASLRLSGQSEQFDKRGRFHSEVGFCWLDLSEQWKECETSSAGRSVQRITTDVWPTALAACSFDDHGYLPPNALRQIGKTQLKVRVTTEAIDSDEDFPRKRMLLYKHNDDLRQEAFAIEFIRTCDDILKASGLDMKLLMFQCTPVGTKRGFVEWVPGSVTLSEICHPFASSPASSATGNKKTDVNGNNSSDMVTKVGLSKFESVRRLGGQKNESLRRIAGGSVAGAQGSIGNNPVQDYLRSVAFDPETPYLIRKDVMDTYVKSCAGYSVITYILGVGDRHLDNLLLHTSGAFFHCDFSFILGSDPKRVNMPMRITEALVDGMGGRESDNYSKFLSLVGAAFLALRRPENVHVLLSLVRLMEASCLPDTSENQSMVQAILGVRDRLQLNLSESRAVSYIEEAVEASLSHKLWIAVDAIHNLGKRF